MLLRFALLAFLVTPGIVFADEAINAKIVKFCEENRGKAVGDGDCYDLAQFALAAAGAKPEFKYKNAPNKGDYVWGNQILLVEVSDGKLKTTGKVSEVLAGDVIQFRDTKWAGRSANGKGTYAMTFTHHTAVVSEVVNGGKTLKLLHQNFRGKKEVLDGSITLADLKEGWIRTYRPNPK